MITLSTEQRQGLADASLVSRLQEFLNATYPESREVPAAEMKAILRVQLQRCQGYGFTTERQAAIYVVTAWLLGERFDEEHAAAVEVLTGDADPDLKAQLLEDWTLLLLRTLEG